MKLKLKRLFNSPLFVGLLALGAMAISFQNILGPLVEKYWPTTAPTSTTSTDLAAGSGILRSDASLYREQTPQPAGQAFVDRSKRQWIDQPFRDPFTPATDAPMEVAIYHEDTGEGPPLARDIFRLVAVIIEPGVKYATLNKTLVSEGDTILDYEVKKIEPHQVQLSGPRGEETLGFGDFGPNGSAETP